MSAVEAALLKIGGVIATAAGKSLLRSRQAAAERRLTLVELAGARGLGLLPQRRLRRQIDQLAEIIAERLEPLSGTELRDLADHERLAALDAVARAFEAADLSDERVLRADVSSAAVEALIKQSAAQVLREIQLGGPGVKFFELVLHEACAYLAEVISTLPSFQNRVLRELLERDTEIIELLREVLDRMPQRGVVSAMGSATEFELEYQRELARKLDRTELFGVTLSGPSRRHRLSVAYIGLSVSVDSDAAEEFSVDDALSGSSRTLITGEAGSGKTTLLQWLAVKCAQGTLESSLAPWNGLVPFFVQLRKFAGRQLPSPGELLNTVAWQMKDRMPSGWAYDVLKSGRGLVLVDGLDEVSARDRDAVREWLSDLAGTFPNCRYVVTSRPPAVSEGWLDDGNYLVAELQPMSRSRTRAFIRHWHEAVAADHPADEHAEVEAYESTLIAAIDASQALRNLTTNPLLCALVCALNYDRRTQLPRERMELYRTALEMLLSRRDIERRVPDAESAVSLSLSEKMLLLEDLAHWFTINELTVADSVRLVRRLGECLRSTRSRELDAEQVFQHLLLRSGLLREHSAGQVDFLHKTFQEYLAAKRIVDTDSIEMLIKQADNDTYGEVIVMAVGHARPGEREKLLDGLLDASEEAAGADGDRRARLQLLAVSCLGTATQLEPSLHRRITDCLRQLIPPKSASEARSLAAMGKDVLPLLRVSDAMKPQEAAATALTAGLVGGAEALPILAALAKDGRGLVIQEVVNAWSYFDPVHFAREVLADAPLSGRSMLINDASVLVGLPHVPQITEVDCRLDGATRPSDLQLLKSTPSLRSLRMSGNDRLRDLGFLRGHPNLSLLELSDCPLLADFSALRDLPELLSVSLKGCGATPDIETITDCERLADVGIEGVSVSDAARLLRTRPRVARLAIRRCQHIRELSELGSSASLRELSLDASRTLESLAGADRFPALRRLELIDCPRLRSLGHHLESTSLESLSLRWCPDIRSLDEVASLRGLKELDLFGLNAYDLSPLAGLRSLARLSVVDCEWLDDLSPLADMPALQMLDVSRSGRRLDLNALRGKNNLVVYHSGNVYNADLLGEHSQVHPSVGKR